MQELTRGGRGSSHSPVWQRTPLYPGWQLQTYPLTWSTHVPPFRQGLLEHSLISAIKDSRLWDGLDRAFGWYVDNFSVIRFKQKNKTSKYSIDLCRGDILSCINPYSFSFNSFCNIAKELRKQSECMSKRQRNPLLSFAFVRVKMADIRWCLFGERFLEMVR